MATRIEGYHAFEALEETGLDAQLSIKTVTVVGTNLPANLIMGDNGTNWLPCDPGNADGSEVAAGMLLTPVNSATPVKALVVNGPCRLNGHLVQWDASQTVGVVRDNAIAELAAKNIRVVN